MATMSDLVKVMLTEPMHILDKPIPEDSEGWLPWLPQPRQLPADELWVEILIDTKDESSSCRSNTRATGLSRTSLIWSGWREGKGRALLRSLSWNTRPGVLTGINQIFYHLCLPYRRDHLWPLSSRHPDPGCQPGPDEGWWPELHCPVSGGTKKEFNNKEECVKMNNFRVIP